MREGGWGRGEGGEGGEEEEESEGYEDYTGLIFLCSSFSAHFRFEVRNGAAHARTCRTVACTCPCTSTNASTAVPHMRAHATHSDAQSKEQSGETPKV